MNNYLQVKYNTTLLALDMGDHDLLREYLSCANPFEEALVQARIEKKSKEFKQNASKPKDNPRLRILLTRDDLERKRQDYLIDKITHYDFKETSISQEEYNKAELVIFFDYPETKVLKQKYRNDPSKSVFPSSEPTPTTLLSNLTITRTPLWQPTAKFRWHLMQVYAGNDAGKTQKVLQQLWIDDLRNEEWRGVPTE